MAKELPAFRPTGRCPKCGGTYGPTNVWYRPGGHDGCAGGTEPSENMIAGPPLIREEHLDRSCPSCGYGWVEAIVPPRPPAFGDPWPPK